MAIDTQFHQTLHVLDHESMLDQSYHLLDSIHSQARMADEKVRALFTANTLFVAALALGTPATISQVTSGGISLAVVLELALRVILFVTLSFSVATSVLALLPRTKFDDVGPSLFFFGEIGSRSRESFVRDFINITPEQRVEQLLNQVHINSKIVQVKYQWIRRSASSLLIAVVLWFVAVGLAYLH